MTDEKLQQINNLKKRIEEQRNCLQNIQYMRSGTSSENTHLYKICIAAYDNKGYRRHISNYDIDNDFIQNVLMLAEEYELIELNKLEKEYEAM